MHRFVVDAATGKTSLIRRYVYKTFHEKHQTTIGVDFSLKKVKIDGKTLNVGYADSTTFRDFCIHRYGLFLLHRCTYVGSTLVCDFVLHFFAMTLAPVVHLHISCPTFVLGISLVRLGISA